MRGLTVLSLFQALSLNQQSSQVSALLSMSLNASIDLGGALVAIKGLPAVLASDEFDPFKVDVHVSPSSLLLFCPPRL